MTENPNTTYTVRTPCGGSHQGDPDGLDAGRFIDVEGRNLDDACRRAGADPSKVRMVNARRGGAR